MTKEDVLEKALRSYSAYYDVNRETPEAPFAAEAVFHSHSSTYFLTRSATIGEAESNEYVFFALRFGNCSKGSPASAPLFPMTGRYFCPAGISGKPQKLKSDIFETET